MLKKTLIMMAICGLMLMPLACENDDGGGSEEPKETVNAPEPSTNDSAPATETPVETATATTDIDPLLQKLVGTSWALGDYTATFVDDTKVKVKGGQIALLSPEGLEAPYSFEKGADGKGTLKISLLGENKTGTWDGAELIIDGNPATKQ